MRELIIDVIGEIGRPSAPTSDLGELVALHSLLDSPKDKILWDVGHRPTHTSVHHGVTGSTPSASTRASPCSARCSSPSTTSWAPARLYLDRLRGRPEGGDAQGDRRGRQGGRGDRRRGAHRRRRLRGAPSRRRTADADGDRPQRQRHVDLPTSARSRATSNASAQPPPLSGPLHTEERLTQLPLSADGSSAFGPR